AGLTLNSATGVISGTPTAAGTSNFTVQATDANGAAATKALAIAIYSGISVTTTSLIDGTVALTYNQTLSAAGGKTPYSWAISAGALPAGLTLNSATGAISGTPAAAGTSNFTARVTDANGATANQALSITVYAALSVTTASLADGTVNLAYSQTLATSGGKSPLTWSITSGVLPAGVSLDSGTGVISGTPTAGGTSNFTVQVVDANGAVSTRTLAITIFTSLAVSTSSLADGTANWAYSQTLAAAGGKTPFAWSLTAGTLPAGLTLNSSTGVISGTPTSAGTANVTVQVTDSNGATATQALSITIFTALSFNTSSLPDGTVSLAYSQTLAAGGGKTPYVWSVVSGSLPAGLALNSTTGVVGGTPTAAGISNFTLRVADSNGAQADSALSINIFTALSITTASLADATVNLPYTQTLVSTGGKSPVAWTIPVGNLPAGLTLNSATGVINGIPTTPGTSNFTVRVTDANGATANQSFAITVYAGLSVTTTSLSDGTVNLAYNQTLAASGGKTPLNWSVITGTLPAGLNLNSSTGVISGTPSLAGTSNFTVQVTDANSATATRALSIMIYTALSLTTTSVNNATVSAAYSQTLAATGGKSPYVWSIPVGTLPAGLAINTSTGVISGTPTAQGTYNFTAQVQDANGAIDTRPLTIVVNQALSITTTTLADGTIALAYSQTVSVSGGMSPFTWSVIVGALPSGLSLNSSTGVISGTPSAAGTSNFTLQVVDANSAVATKSLSITIYSALSITTASLPAGTRTAPYSQTGAASGGKPPLTWSIASGALPAGLTLNSATGVISGTPSAVGTASFTLQVQDSNSAISTSALTIQINEVPAITTASLSSGTAGVSYNQAIIYTGGTVPVVWSIIAGTLPAGLAFNSSTGVISGTPTVRGTSNFTVQVADAYNITGSRAYSIVVSAASPSKANILASKTTITANGTDSATLTVTVYDAYDNLVGDGTTVTVTTTNGTVTGSTTTVNGVVSRAITSTTSGTAALGVESPSGTALTTVTGNTSLSFMSGIPAQANISASKTSIVADGVDQTVLTITVRDADGNLVTNGTTVNLTSTLGTVTGSGTTVSGVVTRYLSGLVTGTAAIGVESPSGTALATVTGNTSVSLLPGVPAKAVVSASKTTVVSDGSDSSTLTVTVFDANNNLVANGTTVMVTTTVGTVTGSSTTVNGVVTRTLASILSGTGVLGVQSPAGSTLSNVTGNLTIVFNPGPPAQANISASKTTIIANGSDSSTLTVTVRDASGNLVPDGTTVRVVTTIGAITGSGTTVSGVITRTLTGTVSGTAGLSVESPTGTLLSVITGNNSIVLQPGPAAGTISLTPVPGSIIANGVTTSTVTSGVIVDAFGNTVLDGSLITVATGMGTITTSDASGSNAGIQVATNSGIISFVVRSSTVSGTAGVTAQSVLGSAAGSTQVAFTAGPPSATNSSMTATTPVFSDGISASTVTITVRDSNMNLVGGASVVLSSNRGVSDIITQPVGVTDSAGQITGTLASTSTGNAVISATVNGSVTLNQTSTVNFYNTKTGSNIVVNPSADTTVIFDTVNTIGITSSVQVGSGTTLPAGYVSPGYFDIGTTATYNGNVTVCINYNEPTYASREGLVKLLHREGSVLVDRTTSVNTVTNTVCGVVTSFSEFATGATNATNLQFTTAPQTVTAGFVSGVVQIEAKDNYGFTDTGYSGTVNITGNSATLRLDTSSGGAFSLGSIPVNMVNGAGTFYFRDTVIGTPTITATDAAAILLPAGQQETISAGVPSGIISLTPVPAGIVADGVTTSTVTSGVIRDVYGNSVANGTLITVSVSNGTITTADASGAYPGIQISTINGVISLVVQSSTLAGISNVTALSVQGSASGSAQITFLPGLPAGTISLTPVPAAIVADGVTTSTVTSGVVTDAYGNTVLDGTLITVATGLGNITSVDVSGAYPGIQRSTVNGVVSFVVQSGTLAGSANVAAQSVNGTASGATQITLLPGAPYGAIALTPSPANIVADGFEWSTVTSGVITDVYGNTVLDGTLVTVATDMGSIITADENGVYPGIQMATVSGMISFEVRSGTVRGTAVITAFSVLGSASGSTQINFIPGPPYGTIALTPNPAIMPADGNSVSTIVSGVIRDLNNNTVSDGTLITVASTMGLITSPDADGGIAGIQVATSGGLIIVTFRSGTTEGVADITANSVQGSATGHATITLTNVPPELNYPSETGYGSGDAVEPNSGLRSTTYTYKIVYRDVNNNAPAFVRICIDAVPCTAMSPDMAVSDPALRDGNYNNGEQYLYSISTLVSGDHVYYFETTDGLAYTKTPPAGSLNSPHVNYPPALSFSPDPGYVTDGVDPDTGNTTATFHFRTVYTDLDNQAPSSIRVCIDAACYAMIPDSAASVTLRDGDYVNGEQYVYSVILTDGTHNYYFDSSDGLEGVLLPQSGSLSGPIVTNTYTPVGLNVVVKPDVNVTITFDQVTAEGDTYVTNSQTGSPLPSGFLPGSPPAYFEIHTTASYTGRVRMCFTYSDPRFFGIGYGGERGLRWLHVEGGYFRDRTVILDVNNNFVCGDVYSFSEFSAAVEEATLVTLTSFKATGMDGKVLLTWSTAAEVDSMGFNILRGPAMSGPFTRINSWLVRSKGSPVKGMTYSFEDTGVENGTTYFYKLENVDVNGKISTHMISSATPLTPPHEQETGAESGPGVNPEDQGSAGPVVKPQVAGTGQEPASFMPPIVIMDSQTGPASGVKDEQKDGEMASGVLGKDATGDELSHDSPESPGIQHAVTERVPKSALKEPDREEYPSPSDFSIKIEDDNGNEMSVRQVREGEKVEGPFEAAIDEGRKVVLKWVSAGNIKGFNVHRRDSKSGKQVKVNTMPMPFFASQSGDKGLLYTFRDNGVTDNTVYEYKIETISQDGSAKESKPVEISTKTPAPAKQ
ncbi:MAG: putative Ig domain-containing protein, partial [Nitrospirae bacterium]|nr:putative Ig domain-containing protein [Nitrospirota bacterium]